MKSKIIAITGGIGSGKSVVLKYLQSLNYPTVNCDLLAKEVASRPQTIEKVRLLLGDEYILDDKLNRVAIRGKVFSDKNVLNAYNAIFFSEVKKLLDERIEKLAEKNAVFVEISVFDAFDYSWDEVWLIEADTEKRIGRAAIRDGTPRETLENIVTCQKVCSTFTRKILNNGTVDDLKEQINAILALIFSEKRLTDR